MSFGRAFRPTTPTTTGAHTSQRSSTEAHKQAKDEAPQIHQQHSDEAQAQEQYWHDQLYGSRSSRVPPRSKFSIPTTPAQLAELAAVRDMATRRSLGFGGGAAIDRAYAAAHAQPNTLRSSYPAPSERPLHNPTLTLRRLALAGIIRPDLARENNLHVQQGLEAEQAAKQDALRRAFLFREAQLGALHARKRERVELEQRASLRAHPVDSAVHAIDEPQFSPIDVPPPSRPHWNAAHQLSRELTRRPWTTPGPLAAKAVEAIEQKASIEAERKRQERAAARARVQAVREREDRMRLANQTRDALIAENFAAVERAPQNLDAHLTYLLSARCAPRPPQATPTNMESCRILPPHAHTKTAHIAHAGWTSLRSKVTYPASTSRSSGRSTQRSARGVSGEQSFRGSSRGISRHDMASSPRSGLSSARDHPSADAGFAEHRFTDESGLTSLANSLQASPDSSPRRGNTAPTAQQGVTSSPQFRAKFAATVAHEQAQQQQQHQQQDDAAVHVRDESSPSSSAPISPRSISSPRSNSFSPSRSRSRGWSGGVSVEGSLRQSAGSIELALSPRSNSRLGVLLRPAHPPVASPRTERLAQPLARLQYVKEIDRSHRDFNGLLEQLPKSDRQEEEKEQPAARQSPQPHPPTDSPRPMSALSSRPATARSRFVRESRGVAPPHADAPTWPSQVLHGVSSPRAAKPSPPLDPHPPRAPAVIPVRPGSRPSMTPRTASTLATPRGDPLQHPADKEILPMWQRANRLQHAIGGLD